MCRFLLYNSAKTQKITPLLKDFAQMCRESKQDQKDGWGVLYKQGSKLILQKSLNPIWEDVDKVNLPESDLMLVHARWGHAKNSLGDLQNNQPFYKDNSLFVFNGLLRRVKMQIPGRIGAEKIFNLLLQESEHQDALKGIEEAVAKMKDSAGLIKAINFLLLQGKDCYIHSYYTIDPHYFDLRLWEGKDEWLISSYPLRNKNFSALPTDQVIKKSLYQNLENCEVIEKPF